MTGAILIPAYNSENLITESITSAQRAGYTNIIVVDNNSTDNTANLAKSLDAKVYVSTTHLTKVENWNRALEIAKYEKLDWIRFLFCGDIIIDSTQEKCEQLLHEGAEFAVFKPRYFSQSAFSESSVGHLFKNKFYNYEDLLNISARNDNPFGPPSTYLLKISSLSTNDIKFETHFSWAADLRFCLDFAKSCGKCFFSSSTTQIDLEARKGFQKLKSADSSIYEEKLIVASHIEQIINKNQRDVFYQTQRNSALKRLLRKSIKFYFPMN